MLDAAGAYMENDYELGVGKSGEDLDAKLGKPTVRPICKKTPKTPRQLLPGKPQFMTQLVLPA